MTTAQTKETTRTQDQAKDKAITEISRVSLYAFTGSAVLIGGWATVCLFAGMLNSGGPLGLASNFVKAVIGQ